MSQASMVPAPAARSRGAEDARNLERVVEAEARRAGEDVALVVLNHDRKDLLLACLEAVARLDPPPHATVVVDNASNDGSADAVAIRFPAVHLLRQSENRGVAGGRNAGIRWILTNLLVEHLVFIDNDTLVEPGAVRELVAVTRGDPRIGMVAPKAFRQPGDRRLLSAGGLTFNPYTGVLRDVGDGETDLGQYDVPRGIQACPGYAFLVRRQVFDRIGMFDEAFNPYGWEDADFSLRAARAGFRLVYAPRAVVYHAGGRAGRGPVQLYERHKARQMMYFVRRHATPLQLCCLFPLLTLRSVWRIARELASGNGNVVRAWFSGVLDRGPGPGAGKKTGCP